MKLQEVHQRSQSGCQINVFCKKSWIWEQVIIIRTQLVRRPFQQITRRGKRRSNYSANGILTTDNLSTQRQKLLCPTHFDRLTSSTYSPISYNILQKLSSWPKGSLFFFFPFVFVRLHRRHEPDENYLCPIFNSILPPSAQTSRTSRALFPTHYIPRKKLSSLRLACCLWFSY